MNQRLAVSNLHKLLLSPSAYVRLVRSRGRLWAEVRRDLWVPPARTVIDASAASLRLKAGPGGAANLCQPSADGLLCARTGRAWQAPRTRRLDARGKPRACGEQAPRTRRTYLKCGETTSAKSCKRRASKR